MKRSGRLILTGIAVVCIGIAVSYPLIYRQEETSNNDSLEELAQMRAEALAQMDGDASDSGNGSADAAGGSAAGESAGDQNGADGQGSGAGGAEASGTGTDGTSGGQTSGGTGTDDASGGQTAGGTGTDDAGGQTPGSTGTDGSGGQTSGGAGTDGTGGQTSGGAGTAAGSTVSQRSDKDLTLEELLLDYVPGMKWRQVVIPEYEETAAPVLLKTRDDIGDRSARENALPYPMKEKIKLDPDRILPELRGIYRLNSDLTGWLKIDDTVIDYPVVQTKDSDFYLEHDFYKKENANGQIILDTKCDPYTPSYNLVISGHHMRNGSMFGNLPLYKDKGYWETHKLVTFDNLMEHGTYVIFAAFASADYDEYEEGFRYNADIQYKIDADQWLGEIRDNMLYDTQVDAEFGDEFITLTTCDRSARSDGRFVVVCRKLREDEVFK